MRALYHFRTRGTGAEGVHIAGIAGALSRLGYEVEFVSPSGIQPGKTKGQSPFSSSSAKSMLGKIADLAPGFVFELMEVLYNIPAFFQLFYRAVRNRPTIIYQRHAFFLCATAVVARVLNVPHVIEVNELAGDDRIRSQPVFSNLATAIDRWVLSSADLVCVVSPHLARRCLAAGVDPNRVLVLPNAVGPEMLTPLGAGRQKARARFGISEDTIVIGFVGWFVPWHKLDQMIDSFAAACTTTPSIALLLVGEGPLGDLLKNKAAEISNGRVIFAGAVEHGSMAPVIDAFDISVVPACNSFRSPIKLLEYMSRATAVLAPDVEPIREVTKHGENAYLFDPEDDASLAAGFTSLAASPTLRRELGSNAAAKVREFHTWDANAARFLTQLNSLQSPGSPSEKVRP